MYMHLLLCLHMDVLNILLHFLFQDYYLSLYLYRLA